MILSTKASKKASKLIEVEENFLSCKETLFRSHFFVGFKIQMERKYGIKVSLLLLLCIQLIKCKATESIQWAWDKANELAYYQGVLNWQFFNRNDLEKEIFVPSSPFIVGNILCMLNFFLLLDVRMEKFSQKMN